MSVKIFRGKYIVAEDAYKYIDADSIMKGCRKLKNTAYHMRQTGKNVSSVSDKLQPSNLYVTGEHFDDYVKNCGDGILDTSRLLDSYADQLILELHKTVDKKQIELNTKAKMEDEKFCAQEKREQMR